MKYEKTSLQDSKQNWLAQEIEREKHISVWKHYDRASDIEINHAKHCAADMVKQQHLNNCDANGVSFKNNITSNLYRSVQNSNYAAKSSSPSNSKEEKAKTIIAIVVGIYILIMVLSIFFSIFY